MKDLINKYIGGIQKFQLRLEALTPVAIRSGEVLSPLTDYHIEGEKLYLLDTKKMMGDIAEKGWLDDFEARVLEYSGSHSGGTEPNAKKKNYFVEGFLKEKDVSIKDYLNEENTRTCYIKTGQEWVQLHSTIKTNDQAYIPGSSIKGAIRTAVMYHWLTETDEGKAIFTDFINSLKEELVRRVSERQKISDKNFNAIKNNKITDKQRSDLKEKENSNKAWLINRFNEFENTISKQVFAESDGKHNASSFFSVSDSLPLDNKNLTVSSLQKKYRENFETKRKREKKKKFTPSIQELINIDTQLEVSVSISSLELDKIIKDNIGYQKGVNLSNLSELFKITKEFSLKYLDKEIGRLDGFKEEGDDKYKGKSYEKSKVSELHNQLISLRNQLKLLANNETMICIGFGKSIFLNTVMMALPYHKRGDDEDKSRPDPEDVIRNVVRILHPYHPANKYFPISYYTTNVKGKEYPLGWLKITNTNEAAYIEKPKNNYTEEELKSGNPLEAVFIRLGKPHSIVSICVKNEIKEFEVQGTKGFLKIDGNQLLSNNKCIVYWRNNFLNFNS